MWVGGVQCKLLSSRCIGGLIPFLGGTSGFLYLLGSVNPPSPDPVPPLPMPLSALPSSSRSGRRTWYSPSSVGGSGVGAC